MPMHDWTRVVPNDYHDFHLVWRVALARQLNTSGLPNSHYARLEHTESKARWRIGIRQAKNHNLVAVIEIISPSNKASKDEFKDLRDKSVELLRAGVNLLLIDPFPPTPRDPQGLHDAIWRALTGKRYTPPEDKPLTLAAYVARGNNTFSAFVEPIAVGDILPDMPLFLTSQAHVPTPLEETYQSAWAGFPQALRPLLA